MNSQRFENLKTEEVEGFRVETLFIDSQSLKGNYLGDTEKRFNPILIPRAKPPRAGFPVVFSLSGLGGNGPKAFADRGFELNNVQQISRQTKNKRAPQAIYVFVDAKTFWGGSQFINSPTAGHYEDYIVKELVPMVKKKYKAAKSSRRWCVMGASSGGYGALHLASSHPNVFGVMAALAPDSYFEASLKPSLFLAAPYLAKVEGLKLAREEALGGKLKGKNAMDILNAIAMTTCYGALPKGAKEKLDYPIDLKSGKIIEEVWQRWLEKDPLRFLPQRKTNLKKLLGIYIDVGQYDEFLLQFGVRQIKEYFKKENIAAKFSEFKGGHFDMAERRPFVYSWLKKLWD